MAQAKTEFQCQACGARAPKWAGQCAGCGEWNTLVEVTREAAGGTARARRAAHYAGEAPAVHTLAEVPLAESERLRTGIGELDRVLGGGLVPGSVVLIGGDPGIGKSTLLLQALASLGGRRTLYVSGEESGQQVALRASRLGLPLGELRLLTETRCEGILEQAARERPIACVVDSIQTLYTDELTAAPGSVSQVRECAARLVHFAKRTQTIVLIVGHVTKEGAIAGPRVLEHMVDTVLTFEGDPGSRMRMVRATKNRFGSVNELGLFAMTERGLREVKNPSAIFLARATEPAPGSVVMVTREGTRPLLLEVQALVDGSSLSQPRRVTQGLDGARLAMLLAVAHRHCGVATHDQDVFVNVVGGVRVPETAADLPVLLAIVSSLRDRPLPTELVTFGEVGLGGELRPVPHGGERLEEAAKHGYRRAIVPRANAPKRPPQGLEVVPVATLGAALDAAFDRA